MASAPQLDLFSPVSPFHDQVFNKRSPLSISHPQRKAVLDRLLEISSMFQQQYPAGRGIALVVNQKLKTSAGASATDSKKPFGAISSTTNPLIARRVAVQKLATRLPFSSTKAQHHARRMQLLGRNSWVRGRSQQTSLNLLRFTVFGFGGTDPWGDFMSLRGAPPFWIGEESDLVTESSSGGLIEEGPHSVGEPAVTETLPPLSLGGDLYLEDIARYKQAPTSGAECLNLDGLLDDLDDFALPAAEESDADSWHLRF